MVVVTGASAGVGRAAAVAFARRGDAVGLVARGAAGLDAARRDVEAAGGEALVLRADVADADAVDAAAARAEDELGPIDVWVNSAMTTVFGPLAAVSAAEFRRATEVTYLGQVHGTMAALRRMRPRDRGAIVQVGSALAYRGLPLQAAYSGAKHAVQGFTEAVRSELLHDGSRVHVTMVQLPALNTPQFSWGRNKMPQDAHPVPPVFQPEVAADAIVWASAHRRREVYVGGRSTFLVWANKVGAGIGDRYLARAGYESQQTDRRHAVPDRDNLFDAVDDDRDFGARGAFDDEAIGRSPFTWASLHRGALAAGALAAAGLGGLARRRMR